MIIDFTANFNNYKNKVLNNYSIFEYICPKCGAKHSFTRHGSYERNVCFVDDYNNVKDERMNILRLRCISCGSTHSILACDVIPYCIYSSSFILKVLTEYFRKERKLSDICASYCISFQLIYTFISRFIDFINSCVTVLRGLDYQATSSYTTIISAINEYNLIQNFSYEYFYEFQWIFLMKKFHYNLPFRIYIGGFY